MTPHINAKDGDIAKIVLAPGDPLRAKYIAENFLENARLVNTVRNVLAYTGTYKGKEITVFSTGMGMPSMGIYCYELYKFYGVENIIRIGSCGAYTPDLNIFDTILINSSYTEGNFAKAFNSRDEHLSNSSSSLNSIILETALEKNIPLRKENVLCSECFYGENADILLARIPQDLNITAVEMESFALFYTAENLNKNAACLLTVVDSICKKEAASIEEREQSLNNMISLALDSCLKL